jgi:solute carrier family 50 protein (sugar transporter)
MTNLDFLATIFCPLLGVLICNAMFTSPFLAVLEARKHKKLGNINPFPFAMVTVCQIGWTIYAYIAKDYYIFFSSAFGIIVGFLLCFTAIHLLERPHHSQLEEKERLYVEGILLVGMTYWIFVTFIATIVLGDNYEAVVLKLIGGSAAGCSLMYYAIPLASISTIIKTKNSSSLYFPTIVINLLNCCLWFIYGLIAIQAPAVYIPNAIGAFISFSEILLCFMYPPKEVPGDDDGSSSVPSGKGSDKLSNKGSNKLSNKGMELVKTTDIECGLSDVVSLASADTSILEQ